MFLYYRLYNCAKLRNLPPIEREKKAKEIVEEERLWRNLGCHTFAPYPPSMKYLKSDKELKEICAARQRDIEETRKILDELREDKV